MPDKSARRSRRSFLDGVLTAGVAGLAGAVLYPVIRYVIPPDRAGPGVRSVVLDPTDPEQVHPETGVFVFGNKPGILVRGPGGEWKAFSAICTHLSCTVRYKADVDQIWCPCHNGFFDLNGINLPGSPPPRPLDAYEVHEKPDGKIVVREGEAIVTIVEERGGLWAWLDDRLGLAALRGLATKKTVPQHRHTIWYYLGGMTLFLFMIQVFTGILLTLYYRPSPDEAYESVRYITGEVSFGWLIRAIHGWTANLLVFVAMVHLASVFFLRAYRKPREVTWITGFILLLLLLGFGFSGYLLPWNELSFFATRVGTEIAGAVPLIGDFIVRVLRGGEDVTGATLSRFYGLHIAILPGLTTILLGLHLYLVQKQGMSTPIPVEKELAGKPGPSIPFIPNFLLRDMVGWLAALGLLAGLAALLPEGDGFFVKLELGQKADPFAAAPAGLKPEWYFLGMFYTLKILPAHLFGIQWLEGEQVGVLAFTIVGLLFFLVPFLDRKAARGERSRTFTVMGVLGVAWFILFTILGWVTD